jgi:glycosyltransferase involved in cell wall biosynthesis
MIPLHIGIVAPSLRLLGGHSVLAERLIQGWNGHAEIRARLLPINPLPPPSFAMVARLPLVRTLISQLQHWRILLREIPKLDIVHVFCTSNSSFYLSGAPAILLAKLFSKPVIANYHGDSGRHLHTSTLVRTLLRSVALNVVPSGYFGEIFRDVGIPTRIVANVADTRRFIFRNRAPLRPRIISTRNFEPIYDIACTLRAFAEVQTRYPDASLVLVGGGSQKASLEALARALRLRCVEFVGRVPQSSIASLYDTADLYVQTPTIDNMPGSVVEAFLSGLPVVSTDVGGVPFILRDQITWPLPRAS